MRVGLSIREMRGEFVRRVEEISGQKVLACNQCGKCSAGCPAAMAMDLLPSQVIRLVQLGLEEALNSETIWLCASCLTCLSRCPKGVDLPRIMEALRQLVLRKEGDRLELSALPADFLREAPQLAIIAGSRKYLS
jgi:heterodisulfide reductase subunit C